MGQLAGRNKLMPAEESDRELANWTNRRAAVRARKDAGCSMFLQVSSSAGSSAPVLCANRLCKRGERSAEGEEPSCLGFELSADLSVTRHPFRRQWIISPTRGRRIHGERIATDM